MLFGSTFPPAPLPPLLRVIQRWLNSTSVELCKSRSPVPAAEAVEHVAPEVMALGQARMVEVVAPVMGHAHLLHHARRPHVGRHGEGHDLVQPDSCESIGNRGPGPLGRITAAPVIAVEPPADLDRWCE